jgi:hypothetical protein
MKLLSGTAFIAPKKFPFIALAIATIAVGVSPFAFAQVESAPQSKTEAALRCLFGFEPAGCETVFQGPAEKAAGVAKQIQVTYGGKPNPHFKTAKYAGANAIGDDVWDVHMANTEVTYVIAPPLPGGKIDSVVILQGAPNRQCDNLVHQLVRGGLIFENCHVLSQW